MVTRVRLARGTVAATATATAHRATAPRVTARLVNTHLVTTPAVRVRRPPHHSKRHSRPNWPTRSVTSVPVARRSPKVKVVGVAAHDRVVVSPTEPVPHGRH